MDRERGRPRIDSGLAKAIARAHRWQRLLESGECASITELAAAEKIDRSYLCRGAAPNAAGAGVVKAIMDGRQPEELTLPALMKGFPVEREMQGGILVEGAAEKVSTEDVPL